MMAGAVAANPYLSRMAKQRAGGAFNVPMQAMRSAGVGSLGGAMVDQTAGSLGYDTGGAFGRWGARAGAGYGLARGGAYAGMKNTAAGSNANRFFTNAQKTLHQGEHAVGQFAHGAMEPMINAATYLPRKGINYISRNAGMGNVFNDKFMAPMAQNGQRWWQNGAQATGRLAGGVGLAATGMGIGNAMLKNKVQSMLSTVVWERLQILPARFSNEAGIIGNAALAADAT